MERLPAPPTSADGSTGHRVETSYRDEGYRSVLVHTHILVKGACSRPPHPHPPPPQTFSTSGFPHDSSMFGKLPELHFPRFDGDNPKLWLTRCANYFEMYFVESSYWVSLALMQLDGPVVRWCQSVTTRLKSAFWDEFSKLLLERFGRDQQAHPSDFYSL